MTLQTAMTKKTNQTAVSASSRATTREVKRSDDIFAESQSKRGMTMGVQEGNRLASQIIKKRSK